MAESEIEVVEVRQEPRSSTAAITSVVIAFMLLLGAVVWAAIKVGPEQPSAGTAVTESPRVP